MEFRAAREYCDALRIGGFSGWTLPKIDELEDIVADKGRGDIKGGITLADGLSLVWSRTSQRDTIESWRFNFRRWGPQQPSILGRTPGAPSDYVLSGYRVSATVLCVRKTD
jgi:hypothetical protein